MNLSQYGDNTLRYYRSVLHRCHAMVGLLCSPGSRSYIFGIHSFIWHTYYMAKAWRMMGWKITRLDALAMLLHDIGYIGLYDLSKKGSRKHVMRGAVIMRRLGYPSRRMVLHSSEIAHSNGKVMSRMGIADKLSMCLENSYWYACRAWLANEQEYYYDVGEVRIPGEDGSFMGLVRFHKRARVKSFYKALRDYDKRVAAGLETREAHLIDIGRLAKKVHDGDVRQFNY